MAQPPGTAPTTSPGASDDAGATGADDFPVGRTRVTVDGERLTCVDVVRIARREAAAELSPGALDRARRAHETVERIGAARAVYGRTTGVGANRSHEVGADDAREHGLRLLRSHAGGTGELCPPELVRATLAIRLNQLAAGGSGVHPRMLHALDGALSVGALPRVHRRGAIGTGDLTALAEIGLTLAGEHPWIEGRVPSIPIDPGDALAFISSNAATLAACVLAWHDLRRLLRASHAVAALSFLALGGSPEAYAAAVHASRPHPGSVACAAEMRRLLGLDDEASEGRRLQDPFGLRAFPQVQGPALEAVDALEAVLAVDINAAAENPLISADPEAVYHHGHFATAHLALALDGLRAAVHHVAELSAMRLGDLVEPDQTGLAAFLADGPAGSSGIMILEYVTHDALSELRHAASPVTLGNAVISRGLEDHASFTTQAARSTATSIDAYRTMLACELIGAVRALWLSDAELGDIPVSRAYATVRNAVPMVAEDHPLTDEIARAAALVDDLADC
ncbi:MAG: aromatic amino acid ammonia-lyase [Actinomycetota bacterium]|nr:aromatic amino acid ammonia-lyase [Actinomycetota bacterium]